MKKKFLMLIGIILLLFILSRIEINKTISIMLHANLLLVFFVFILNVFALFFRSFKWKYLSKQMNANISFFDTVKYYFIGIFLGILTPGRIGDFSKAVYTKHVFGSLTRAFSSVFVDRLIDIIILVLTGSIAILLLSFSFGLTIVSLPLLLVFLLSFLIMLFFFFKSHYLKPILKPLFNILVPEKYKNRLKGSYNSFFESVKQVSSVSTLTITACFSVISWLFSITASFVLAVALGLPLAFGFFFLVFPVITLLDLLPISMSGIGTRDAALIFLFSFYGVLAESAVAFSLIYLLVAYWLIAFIGFLFFIREPIKI